MSDINPISSQAVFVQRNKCISCGSSSLKELSSGRFAEKPLNTFLKNDPWGISPLPFLSEASWQFVQCNDCNQKFHNRILNDEWLTTYYSQWISAGSIEKRLALNTDTTSVFGSNFKKSTHSAELILLLEKITRQIRESDAIKILDYGCGTGQFLAMCQLFGFETYGVEPSAARERDRHIEFFATIEQVEELVEPGFFHAVTLLEVLEHLADPLGALLTINKLTKSGGFLILETPNCKKVIDIDCEDNYRLIHPLGHINGFDPNTLENIALKAGFKRVKKEVVQFAADKKRVYKREARRILNPLISGNTQQLFIKDN